MYKPALNIYVRPQHRRKIPKLAGMLRGLLNNYDGHRAISGLTNAYFSDYWPVRVRFSSVEKADSFKHVAEAALGRYIRVHKILAA